MFPYSETTPRVRMSGLGSTSIQGYWHAGLSTKVCLKDLHRTMALILRRPSELCQFTFTQVEEALS